MSKLQLFAISILFPAAVVYAFTLSGGNTDRSTLAVARLPYHNHATAALLRNHEKNSIRGCFRPLSMVLKKQKFDDYNLDDLLTEMDEIDSVLKEAESALKQYEEEQNEPFYMSFLKGATKKSNKSKEKSRTVDRKIDDGGKASSASPLSDSDVITKLFSGANRNGKSATKANGFGKRKEVSDGNTKSDVAVEDIITKKSSVDRESQTAKSNDDNKISAPNLSVTEEGNIDGKRYKVLKEKGHIEHQDAKPTINQTPNEETSLLEISGDAESSCNETFHAAQDAKIPSTSLEVSSDETKLVIDSPHVDDALNEGAVISETVVVGTNCIDDNNLIALREEEVRSDVEVFSDEMAPLEEAGCDRSHDEDNSLEVVALSSDKTLDVTQNSNVCFDEENTGDEILSMDASSNEISNEVTALLEIITEVQSNPADTLDAAQDSLSSSDRDVSGDSSLEALQEETTILKINPDVLSSSPDALDSTHDVKLDSNLEPIIPAGEHSSDDDFVEVIEILEVVNNMVEPALESSFSKALVKETGLDDAKLSLEKPALVDNDGEFYTGEKKLDDRITLVEESRSVVASGEESIVDDLAISSETNLIADEGANLSFYEEVMNDQDSSIDASNEKSCLEELKLGSEKSSNVDQDTTSSTEEKEFSEDQKVPVHEAGDHETSADKTFLGDLEPSFGHIALSSEQDSITVSDDDAGTDFDFLANSNADASVDKSVEVEKNKAKLVDKANESSPDTAISSAGKKNLIVHSFLPRIESEKLNSGAPNASNFSGSINLDPDGMKNEHGKKVSKPDKDATSEGQQIHLNNHSDSSKLSPINAGKKKLYLTDFSFSGRKSIHDASGSTSKQRRTSVPLNQRNVSSVTRKEDTIKQDYAVREDAPSLVDEAQQLNVAPLEANKIERGNISDDETVVSMVGPEAVAAASDITIDIGENDATLKHEKVISALNEKSVRLENHEAQSSSIEVVTVLGDNAVVPAAQDEVLEGRSESSSSTSSGDFDPHPEEEEKSSRSPRRNKTQSKSASKTKKKYDEAVPILVQGTSLKTFSYHSPTVDRVNVVLKSEGRPIDADVELWQGPDNTPCKVRVYVENGKLRPFSAFVETPGSPNTIAVRNQGKVEFPLFASINSKSVTYPLAKSPRMVIQGSALRTYPFETRVKNVQILLKTDGRPLHAKVELLQGPNNMKQAFEVFTDDGMFRTFATVIETPGNGNVIRVINLAPVEFPLYAWVEPFELEGKGEKQVEDGLGKEL